MSGRLTDRLRQFYDPRSLPAPLGRSAEGWPLLGCAACEGPIPWRMNHGRAGGPESPRTYYVRQFCDRQCLGRWDGDTARVARMRTMVPPFLDPWSLPLSEVPPFARRLPTFEEITHCAHCHARGPFTILVVGKTCFQCGHLNFARDGAWGAERQLVHEA